MTSPLYERFGVQRRELVAIVGAGGKSTIMFTLGRELAASPSMVILTTTTRIAADQLIDPACWSDDPVVVDAALVPVIPIFVATGRIPGKVTGPSPTAVNRLFTETRADHIIVEADGARSMAIKAPADHEPVIPTSSTTVIVVAAVDAIGRPISQVAHRPHRLAGLIQAQPDDHLTIGDVATVLLHAEGGLKGIPENARVVMATTNVTPATRETARELVTILESHSKVERAITLARSV
jgi:molybdenum cofactor cytidylyltransferase